MKRTARSRHEPFLSRSVTSGVWSVLAETVACPKSATAFDHAFASLLSINDNPANKVKIGWVSEWTDSRQWNKFSTRKSPAVTLTEGQRYYVEAWQKEGGGGDNLAVGWAKPGESTSAPSEVIPGSVLSPFTGSSQ
jgi:hypothetical protein